MCANLREEQIKEIEELKALRAEVLKDIANTISKHTPKGYVISLCIEDGAAWVQLGRDGEGYVDLPNSTDRTLLEQLNDALCVANGWNI